METYLEHSKKGTSWSKPGAKYISRVKKNGKWVYTYKIRKAKQVVDDASTKLKSERERLQRLEDAKNRQKINKKLRSTSYKIKTKVEAAKKKYHKTMHDAKMRKISKQQVKLYKEMRHSMNEYGYLIHSVDELPAQSENYLIHSKGPWKKGTKYIKRVKGKNGKWHYIYKDKYGNTKVMTHDTKRTYMSDGHGDPEKLWSMRADGNDISTKDYNSTKEYLNKNSSANKIESQRKAKEETKNRNKEIKKVKGLGYKSRQIAVAGELGALIYGEQKLKEKTAASRDKISDTTKKRLESVEAGKKKAAEQAEKKRLIQELNSRGYGDRLNGNPPIEYLRELEYNTRKNRY